jgi:hypothetical protein
MAMEFKELIELYYRNELNEAQAKELEDLLSSDKTKMREFLMAAHENNAIREALKETQKENNRPAEKASFTLLSPKYIMPAAAGLMIIASITLMLSYSEKEKTNGALLGTSRAMSFPMDMKIQRLNGKKILELKLKDEWNQNYCLSLKTPESLEKNKIIFTLAPKTGRPPKNLEQKYIISADCFKLEADFEKGGASLNIEPGAKTKFIGINPSDEGWLIEYQ